MPTECNSCSRLRSCPSPPDLLRDLAAAPRPTGGAAIAAARERCARELRALRFDVRETPFDFSSFPGRVATPLIGGAAAALTAFAGFAGQRGAAGWRLAPLLILAIGGIVLFLAAWWLTRRGVLHAPFMRERGVNLEATRGGAPTLWLCAHLDSKSQPVSTLIRTLGIGIEAAGLFYAVALAVGAALGAQIHSVYWVQAAIVTLAGAIPVVLSTVGARSYGAFDNASGVATMIETARQLASEPSVGIVITDAEELGLAGARAWSHGRATGTVLNCDGVDDLGRITVMYTGARPERLLGAIERASRASGVPCETRRMIPGILMDSVAFTDGGMDSVTFSRGSVRSLVRVHSRRDNLANLRGTGIAETATLIAATARDIIRGGAA